MVAMEMDKQNKQNERNNLPYNLPSNLRSKVQRTTFEQKNAECAALWHEWFCFSMKMSKHSKECKDLRKKWCKCVDEHSKMISHLAKTNPRYEDMRMTTIFEHIKLFKTS